MNGLDFCLASSVTVNEQRGMTLLRLKQVYRLPFVIEFCSSHWKVGVLYSENEQITTLLLQTGNTG